MKKAIIISILSIIALILLFSTKVVNIQHMESQDDPASSYSEYSAIIYVLAGLMLIFIAFWTFKIHIVAGIIPFGIGFSALVYGVYICYAKGMLAF